MNFFDRRGLIAQVPSATDCILNPEYCEAWDWNSAYGCNPGMYLVEQPGCETGGGGDGDDGGPPPLQCGYIGAIAPQGGLTNEHDNFGNAGPAYADPISLVFFASGGTGQYSFSVLQFVTEFGTIRYADGVVLRGSGISRFDNLLPEESSQDGGVFTFSDLPGLWTTDANGSALVSASVTKVFITEVSVTSGNQFVNCPQVSWAASFSVDTVRRGGRVTTTFNGQAVVTGVN